jgi:hypothetical protein
MCKRGCVDGQLCAIFPVCKTNPLQLEFIVLMERLRNQFVAEQVGLDYTWNLCGMPFLDIRSIRVADRAEFPTTLNHVTGPLRRFNALAPDNAAYEAQSRNNEDLLANKDNALRSVSFHIVPLMSN